jgi:hypothetical protein
MFFHMWMDIKHKSYYISKKKITCLFLINILNIIR